MIIAVIILIFANEFYVRSWRDKKDLRKEKEDIERAWVIYYFFHLLIVYTFFMCIIFWNINYIEHLSSDCLL